MSYGLNKKRNKAYLSVRGDIARFGDIDCKFALQVTRKGHSLNFLTATTYKEDEDLQKLAINVKNALLAFISTTDEVPDAYRDILKDCVLNHHLQKRPLK